MVRRTAIAASFLLLGLGCRTAQAPRVGAVVPPQMPQLRLGDFAFQNAALADWPTGGLRFHLRRRHRTQPKEEGR